MMVVKYQKWFWTVDDCLCWLRGYKIELKFSQQTSGNKMLICPNRVAQLCYDFYSQKIPSKNKPVANQWTTLAAILMTSNNCKGYLNTYRSTWLLKLKNFIWFFLLHRRPNWVADSLFNNRNKVFIWKTITSGWIVGSWFSCGGVS